MVNYQALNANLEIQISVPNFLAELKQFPHGVLMSIKQDCVY